MIGNVGAVFVFEWKRAFTWPRMTWSIGLAAFPVFIIGLVRWTVNAEARGDGEIWRTICIVMLFGLIPMLVTMLGTLLWSSPAISSELERRSWVYLAVRPNGGTAVLLGKYLAAVTWVIPPALIGLTIAVPLAATGDTWRIWWAMTRLVLLSAPAYAAIYLVLGVVMPRRAMVLAVAYTLIFELLISFIPAVINKFTVQFRLRSLTVEWCDLSLLTNEQQWMVMAQFGTEPPWHHVTALIVLILCLTGFAVILLRAKEFPMSVESDA